MKNKVEGEEAVTGRLENWLVQQVTKKEFVIWGNCHNDVHERWDEGEWIHTSGIKNRKPVKSGDVVKTRNSTYLLGKKRRGDGDT